MEQRIPRTDQRVTVGHAVRAYLGRTETFIYNQLATLRRYRPVVVAHHRRPNVDYPLGAGAISGERLAAPLAWLEALAYSTVRVTLPPGNALLAGYLREQDARLLHFHYLTDARFLLALQRRTGLPAIVSGYGYDVSAFPSRWGGLGNRYLRPIFDRFDCFLAMSDDMRRDLTRLGCPERKIVVHYHGSDTRRFRFPERVYERDGPLTILCCAQFERRKGQHLVLQALRRLVRRGRDQFRVVLVGDGPAREALHSLVADLGWHDRVIFSGHVPYLSDALVQHYRNADIFVHPSITVNGIKEGIPGTIVEAMASGLPVIGSKHAGIPAVITPGRTGLLVPEEDLDALAAALEILLDDANLRARLGRAAADHAAGELDLTARTRQLELIYDRYV